MHTLYLLRHAKSSWGEKGVEDHDRPLNARGRKTAPKIGVFMRQAGFIPALILCSSARRTRDTVEAMGGCFPPSIPIRYLRDLYLAKPEEIIGALRAEGGEADSVMIVGHSPGMELTTLALARQEGSAAERALRQRVEEKFPTSALAVLRFDLNEWADLRPDSGALEAFIRPKDLPECEDDD